MGRRVVCFKNKLIIIVYKFAPLFAVATVCKSEDKLYVRIWRKPE